MDKTTKLLLGGITVLLALNLFRPGTTPAYADFPNGNMAIIQHSNRIAVYQNGQLYVYRYNEIPAAKGSLHYMASTIVGRK